jgi:hypothetical protein
MRALVTVGYTKMLFPEGASPEALFSLAGAIEVTDTGYGDTRQLKLGGRVNFTFEVVDPALLAQAEGHDPMGSVLAKLEEAEQARWKAEAEVRTLKAQLDAVRSSAA